MQKPLDQLEILTSKIADEIMKNRKAVVCICADMHHS